ncbi:hypothetical protein ACROYT_G021918 [Oculina patagonica]
MESKTFLLVFCLVSAAWFMSDTEALYSQNPPNNGRRSMRPSNFLSRQRNIRDLCAAVKDVCKRETKQQQYLIQ